MNILNKYCPRSGKPVQEDSLTEYRGHTVGFCNQGCRDDFESNMKDRPEDRHYFDTLINKYDFEMAPQKTQHGDKSAIEQLLESCQLPHEDLTEGHLEHFFVIKKRDEILGVVGLEIFDKNGLLRSLAVTNENRGKGLGKILVRHIEDHAKGIGIKELYLLTTTANGFFANWGYAEIERDEIPENVQESEEFSTLCPASAVAMRKSLD